MLRRAILASLLVLAPALALAQSQGTPSFRSLNLTGSGSTGDVSGMSVTPSGTGVSALLKDAVAALRPHVATNAALKTSGTWFTAIRRNGFYAAGDGGAMDYTWSGSNCTAADDGAQVQPTGRTGCWIADPAAPLYFETFGAKGDGTSDDGPAIRAALAYGASAGKPIRVRKKGYLLNSLDPSGLGAIVLGTGVAGNNAPSADLIGEGTALLPDNVFALGGPFLKLGNGLNRPLVYVQPNTRNPTWSGIALTGNKTGQTGWTGGPNGMLFTVQIADDAGGGGAESGFRMDGVVIRDGYNGNLYLGSGRGGLWLKDTWSQYSGQSTADFSIWLNGYDATLLNVQAGSNAGDGVYVGQGSQYQLIGGAYFLNGGRGLRINGNKVPHLIAAGINFQGNGMEGVSILNSAPYSGAQGGLLAFSNVVFEGNSGSASGTYSDIKIDTNVLTTITGAGFPGRVVTTGQFATTLPKYNIEAAGSSRVALAGITMGSSPGAGTSYTVAFTNSCAVLTGDIPVACTWTPAFKGDSTAGTPTYSKQFGSYTRTGNTVTAAFQIDLSSLGGAVGNGLIGGLPLFSAANSADFGSCTVGSWGGWTAPTGKVAIGGFVPSSSGTVYLYVNSTDGTAAAPLTIASLSATARLYGTCTYRVTN